MEQVKEKHYIKPVVIVKAPLNKLSERTKLDNPAFGFSPFGLKPKANALEAIPVKAAKSDKAGSDDGKNYERKVSKVSSIKPDEKEKRLESLSDED